MGACGSSTGPTVMIDFENCTPTDNEKEQYDKLETIFVEAERVLKLIEDYKGCQELARAAMSQPTPQNEKAAFEGLLLSVESIAAFFNFSKALDKIVQHLLLTLAQNANALETQQALCKQLARVFDFVLRFDQTRMMRPNLSNDFSYYRRLLPKFYKHPDIKIKDDDASGMALFTAEHIPMNSCINKAGIAAADQSGQVSTVLAIMAMSCCNMLRTKRFSNERTNVSCARAMTGAIVMFDNIDTLGAFSKRSPINIKLCVTILKREFAPKDFNPLLNAIHYSTKNFNDAPQGTQNLFD